MFGQQTFTGCCGSASCLHVGSDGVTVCNRTMCATELLQSGLMQTRCCHSDMSATDRIFFCWPIHWQEYGQSRRWVKETVKKHFQSLFICLSLTSWFTVSTSVLSCMQLLLCSISDFSSVYVCCISLFTDMYIMFCLFLMDMELWPIWGYSMMSWCVYGIAYACLCVHPCVCVCEQMCV